MHGAVRTRADLLHELKELLGVARRDVRLPVSPSSSHGTGLRACERGIGAASGVERIERRRRGRTPARVRANAAPCRRRDVRVFGDAWWLWLFAQCRRTRR